MKTPRFWQSLNLTSALLLPASLLYGVAAWLDRVLTTPKQAPLPVIAVGNVTAGGAGKTPTVLALIPLLKALGHTPHILTRGYGGTPLAAHRVKPNDDWHMVGDEALLLAATAPTWVGRNRLASAQAAKNAGATILVCDDALQHHALHKDISLLVIDGTSGIGNKMLLPAGPLREPLAAALKRTDAVVIIGEDTQQLAVKIPAPLFTGSLKPTIAADALNHTKWIAFAGIGRPEKFFMTLRELHLDVIATHAFSDHHAYREEELTHLLTQATAHGAHLITTAKDAVKIPTSLQPNITIVPVELRFDNPSGIQDFLALQLRSIPTS